jgi:general secretion pathway protein N
LADPSRHKPDAGNRGTTANPLWAIPLRRLAATRDRPLFSPTRRPPALPIASVPQPRAELPVKPEKPPFLLIGTIIGANGAIGVFRDETTKRVVSLRSGERRSGWLLDRVHKRDVVLQKDNSNVFLALSPEATAPVTVAMQQPEPRLVRRQR